MADLVSTKNPFNITSGYNGGGTSGGTPVTDPALTARLDSLEGATAAYDEHLAAHPDEVLARLDALENAPPPESGGNTDIDISNYYTMAEVDNKFAEAMQNSNSSEMEFIAGQPRYLGKLGAAFVYEQMFTGTLIGANIGHQVGNIGANLGVLECHVWAGMGSSGGTSLYFNLGFRGPSTNSAVNHVQVNAGTGIILLSIPTAIGTLINGQRYYTTIRYLRSAKYPPPAPPANENFVNDPGAITVPAGVTVPPTIIAMIESDGTGHTGITFTIRGLSYTANIGAWDQDEAGTKYYLCYSIGANFTGASLGMSTIVNFMVWRVKPGATTVERITFPLTNNPVTGALNYGPHLTYGTSLGLPDLVSLLTRFALI